MEFVIKLHTTDIIIIEALRAAQCCRQMAGITHSALATFLRSGEGQRTLEMITNKRPGAKREPRKVAPAKVQAVSGHQSAGQPSSFNSFLTK